jgi:hypothetical protein
MQDVMNRFPSSTALEENIIVFPMGITGYCITTQIAFKLGIVSVKRIGKPVEPIEKVCG